MTISYETSVLVARPPGEVFDHLIDVERWPDWLIASGIVRVDRVDEGPLAPGARWQIDQRVAGRSATLDASLVTLDRPSRFALTGRDLDGVMVDIDATLAPEGASTRLTWRLRIGLPLRYRWLEGMARPQVERAAALDLEAFRRRLGSVAED